MPNDELNVSDLAKELIAYSIVNSPTYTPPEVNEYELTDQQSNYLQGLVAGKRPVEMCESMGMSRVQPYLWKKNHKLFREALELMGRLAELKVSIMRLAREVKKTIRKVNSLEKIVIPDLRETVAFTRSRIEESE